MEEIKEIDRDKLICNNNLIEFERGEDKKDGNPGFKVIREPRGHNIKKNNLSKQETPEATVNLLLNQENQLKQEKY